MTARWGSLTMMRAPIASGEPSQNIRPGHIPSCTSTIPPARGANAGALLERPDLDVVAPDHVIDAAQAVDALHLKRVRPDPVHARAHLHEDHRELLDVRLARGVPDDRPAGREDGTEERVLGRRDRRLVEEH